MKRLLYVLLALLLLIAAVWYFFDNKKVDKPKDPAPESMHVSKHSDAFNQSISSLLNTYYSLSEGLVNWDTAIVNRETQNLVSAFDQLKLEELKKDSSLIFESAQPIAESAKGEAVAMQATNDLTEKRNAFNRLSDNLRMLFVIVKYDKEKIYWQECPMAFGDDAPGNWLSKTKEVRNPYLGTKHPEFKATMLKCGLPKDTLNFMN